MTETEAGAIVQELLAKPATLPAINRLRLLKPLFTSCPRCGSEPWVNIDCGVCEVMSHIPPDGLVQRDDGSSGR